MIHVIRSTFSTIWQEKKGTFFELRIESFKHGLLAKVPSDPSHYALPSSSRHGVYPFCLSFRCHSSKSDPFFRDRSSKVI